MEQLPLHPAGMAIIGITVLISYYGFKQPAFFQKYMFQIGPIKRGERIRMISSGFLHLDWQHLFVNMLSLYFFTDLVIFGTGYLEYVVLYIFCLIAGNLTSFLFHKDEPAYSAIGASGAVSGIVYAGIILFPEMKIYGIIPGYIFGIGYLFYSIYGMQNRLGNIGHDAHFGGAVAGLVGAIAFRPEIMMAQPVTVGLMLIPIVVLYVLKRMGKV